MSPLYTWTFKILYLLKKIFENGQLGFRTFGQFTICFKTVKDITEKSHCKNIVWKIINNKLGSDVGFDLQKTNAYNMVYTIYGVIHLTENTHYFRKQ